MARREKDSEKENFQKGQKGSERIGWRERLCRSLDIVPDALSGESLVEIRGRGLLRLRGGGKILVYTPQRICVALKRGVLSIEGARLVCVAYHAEAMEVEGEIASVSFDSLEEET